MPTTPILASGHTTSDGMLNLKVATGVPDTDVTVEIRVLAARPADEGGQRDANGWPLGFLERFAGSIPDLERGSQGEYEARLPL